MVLPLRWCMSRPRWFFLMTTALELFYGGMVRSLSVLNVTMMSFIAIPLAAARGWSPATAVRSLTTRLIVTFQLTFVVITAPLISGRPDRARFVAWIVFVPI